MTQYRYLFADLVTNDILAELPLTNVTFSQVLNSSGTLNGEILGSDVNESGYDFPNTTVPARTAIYVDRDGVLIWGGILWTRSWNSDSQSYSFSAREFPSYFERRRITDTTVFENTDQLVIVETLITDAQNVPGGDIGVIVGSETSGILVDRVYFDYEFKDVWGAIKDLSNQQDGFDFNIDVDYFNNNPTKYLRLDYPARGRTFSYNDPAALVFDFPGNLVYYEYPEDGSITTNLMYGIGPNSNEGMIRAVATSPTNQIAAGFPLLEDTTTYNDQYDPDLLYQQTLGEVTAKQLPVVTMKIVIPAYENPVLGSYKTGDQCLVRITDDRFPQPTNGGYGFVAIKRIVAINVEPGEDGPERVTLTLADLT